MLQQRKVEEPSGKQEDTTVFSFLFMAGVSFALLLSANALISFGIWDLFVKQKIGISTDVLANVTYLVAALLSALILDAGALFDMFGRSLHLAAKGLAESPNPIVALWQLNHWEKTVSICTVVVNWLAGHGLMCSGLKLGMSHPVNINSVSMSTETMHDLVSGDLLLNPLLRTWNWETVYGMACGLHLCTYFAIAVAYRARFNTKKLAPLAIGYGVLAIFIMALAGFFRRKNYTDGWLGPSDGFWLVFCNLVGVYLAYNRWWEMHPSEDTSPAAEFQEGIRAFADEWRGWKPLTVFMLTTFLSVVFAYATPIYPIILALTYAFHCKSHQMDKGWNKTLLFLTITHQVLHYFVHSYRTLEDQPLLWIDKFVHFLYAVVAAQQFRENRELLSNDPLVKAFNYINIYVWIPGDIMALYIAALHGPSDTYLKHMIGWGGYCLSTGTAMAYVNNDVWEDSAENSARRFIVQRKGLTGHGIQIFQALLFAVVYIVSTGGSAEWGRRIEYIYDYASHLYTGYGAL
jgi:hypothetical protein